MSRSERIAHLLGRLHTDQPLSAAEYDECLRLGIKPDGERPRKRGLANLAIASGCSPETFRSIFG